MSAVITIARVPQGARLQERWFQPALALALAALFWSGNFVAGRSLRGQIDPLTLNFLRWLLALVLIVPFVWRQIDFAVLRREWRLLLALGATGLAGFHTLTYHALRSTTATNALLVLSLVPIVTLLGTSFFWAERPNTRQRAGAAISIGGAAVLITRGDVADILKGGLTPGDLWMLLGVLIWSAYTLLMRRRPADLPPTVAVAGSAAAALVLMAPPLAVLAPTPLAALAAPAVLLSLGYIAVFASAIAFLLWSYGVARIGPARAGQFLHLMPVFGAILAFLVLGEAPLPAQLAGAALVLSGLALFERASPHSLTKEENR